MPLPVKEMPLNTMRHTLGGREQRNKAVQSVLRDGTKLGQPDFTKNYRYWDSQSQGNLEIQSVD